MSGHVYGGRATQLLYVGEAKNGLSSRWKCPKHCDYFSRHSKVLDARLYCALLDHAVLDVETVLIYVHQPNHNTSKKNGKLPRTRYLIRSTGTVPPGLLTDIDSGLGWFDIESVQVDSNSP